METIVKENMNLEDSSDAMVRSDFTIISHEAYN